VDNARLLAVGLVGLGLVTTVPARALDLAEIQVYQSEVNRPGQFGLEVHTNYTLRGKQEVEYPGHIPPHRALRLTLEPAIGVTEWLELGVYLQMLQAPDVGVRWAGAKLRAKFVAPRRLTGRFMLGLNVEVGKVPEAIEQEGWANELRPILGYEDDWFLAAFNPIVGYAFSGEDRLRPHFEPAFKAWINTQRGFALGLEYYAGLGLFSQGFSPLREQEHLALVAFDLTERAGQTDDEGWELNVAFGRGFGPATAQDWLLKTIVGKAF